MTMQQIDTHYTDGALYVSTTYRGAEYVLMRHGNGWGVSTRRLALGRHNMGGFKPFDSLDAVAAGCKAFGSVAMLVDLIVAAGPQKTAAADLAAAEALNAHHHKHAAGFYSRPLGRCFAARTTPQGLQASPDFGRTWLDVPAGTRFVDYHGSEILTTAAASVPAIA